MSKFTIIGGLLCLGGLLMIIFQAVSSMMTVGEIAWQSLSIVDIVNAEYLKWIDGISWHSIQKIGNVQKCGQQIILEKKSRSPS